MYTYQPEYLKTNWQVSKQKITIKTTTTTKISSKYLDIICKGNDFFEM